MQGDARAGNAHVFPVVGVAAGAPATTERAAGVACGQLDRGAAFRLPRNRDPARSGAAVTWKAGTKWRTCGAG